MGGTIIVKQFYGLHEGAAEEMSENKLYIIKLLFVKDEANSPINYEKETL